MRVLVTGASGVIGQELVKLLSNHSLLLVDIVPSSYCHIDVIGDLATPEVIYTISKYEPDVVFHLAAVFERTIEDTRYWRKSFRNNVLASHYLIKAAPQARFIFASSYLVYDPCQYLDQEDIVYLQEDAPILPRNVVGAAKFFTEQELRFSTYNYIAARIWRVYGKGSRDIISRIARGEINNIYGVEAHFDYIYAKDVAKGLFHLGLATQETGVINLGSGVPTQFIQVTQCFPHIPFAFSDREVPIEKSAANMNKLRDLIKWNPQNILSGIQEIIEYENSSR